MNRTKVLFLVLPVWVFSYSFAAFLAGFRVLNYLPMWIDVHIGLWTPAVYAYILYYPLCILSFFIVKDFDVLKKGAMAFVSSVFFNFLIFVIYPVAFYRPENLVVDDLSSFILSKIWVFDTVANSFPSQHVTSIWVCAFFVSVAHRNRKWIPALAFVIAFIISASTLFVKQHYVWDVIAGFFVACAVSFVMFRKTLLTQKNEML